MKRYISLAISVLLGLGLQANISLPAIFSDHMVLQQNAEVTIWGWGKPNEVIKVTVSWDPQKEYSIKVPSQSTWSIAVQTPVAGGPYNVILEGYNTIEIDDVLIGEVWLGSGQSNMEWAPHMNIDNAESEKATANYPEIRFFTVLTSTAATPQQHLQGEWVKCTPESMWRFSALMYFFGRELYRNLQVPMGLVNSSWGGTPIEVWLPEYRILGDKLLNENAKLLKPVPWGPHEPAKAYNAMIHPLIPFKIKGVLWYQGESNTANSLYYARSLTTLIDSWRAAWGYDFPFYFAQIAPYNGYGADNVNGAVVRDQQRQVLGLRDHTGMAVLSDIGDLENIHPGNKQDVGKRLAAWALYHDYGKVAIPFSGPLYSSYEMKKGKIILHFQYAAGLAIRGGDLKEFTVLDAEGKWISAPAKINKETVELDVSAMSAPRGVRYAFRNDSQPNLFNGAGLPASCFEVLF